MDDRTPDVGDAFRRPAVDVDVGKRLDASTCPMDDVAPAPDHPSRSPRGGQPACPGIAILTALTLRAVFRLALRQTEGPVGSVVTLLDLAVPDLAVPDHGTPSRRTATVALPRPRACPGAGPFHLSVDSTGMSCAGPASGRTRGMARGVRRS